MVRLPNPRYPELAGRAHRALPWLGGLAHRAYSLAFDTFAGALTKPGLRRKAMGALCRASLRSVRDPGLRAALTPDYQPMCKRLVVSGGFYRAIQRADVELVTAGVDHLERRGIVTADGVLHEADVIVLATGFDTHAFFRPMRLTGRDGITADEVWRDGPRGYQTRLPELLHDARAAQPGGQPRADVGGRVAGRSHPAVDPALAPWRIRHRGADPVGHREVQRRAARRDAAHGVDDRL